MSRDYLQNDAGSISADEDSPLKLDPLAMSQAERTTFVFDKKGLSGVRTTRDINGKSRLKQGYSSPPQCYSNTYSVRSPRDSRDSSVVLWSMIHNRRNNLQVDCSLHGCTVNSAQSSNHLVREAETRQRGTWGNTAQRSASRN